MLKLLILTTVFAFILFSSAAFASITYVTCEINNCILTIGECSSGILDIYPTSTCSGLPSHEFTFAGSTHAWKPAAAGVYYLRAFCDDGVTKTDCSYVSVRSAATTTTTSAKEECPFECCFYEPGYYDKPCPGDEDCIDRSCVPAAERKDYTWVAVVIIAVIIAVVLFLVFFVFKKKPRKSFEELYRKWSR